MFLSKTFSSQEFTNATQTEAIKWLINGQTIEKCFKIIIVSDEKMDFFKEEKNESG